MAVTRIPAERSSAFKTWAAPEVKEGQIVQVEKLKQRGPRGELINISKEAVIYSSITAAQLEEISSQAYEDTYQQAYQDGLKQGQADGYQAGLEAGQRTIATQVEGLHTAIAQLQSHLGEQDDEVEQALVNLVTCIARSVVRRELHIDATQIRQVVDEALAALPMGSANINIHLSEQDYQLLKNHPDTPPQWQLHIDRTLSVGGCRINSQHSVVDFTLEDQFQQTINALVEQPFAELAARAKARTQANSDSSDTKG